MAATRASSTNRRVPPLSPSAAAPRPRSGSASASATSRSAASSARPFSSTNLSATVASSRFKTFAVQYEILCKNPMLCELAKEVPWKNLLDLFTLKFYAVGDVLWHHGDHPTELAFVLCGGFLVRHMREDVVDIKPDSRHMAEKPPERCESIVSEKLLKPGASIAVHAVDQCVPIRYTVTTAKFKSILIALPIGKFKSVMRQLTAPAKSAVQQLIYENESTVCVSIKLLPPKAAHNYGRASTAPAGSPLKRPGSPLRKSVSHPVLPTQATDPAVQALHTIIHTASWDSLKVAKPVEYEVNSSLLILHESESAGKLHMPSTGNSAGEQLRAELLRGSSSSSTIRTIAKKHTARRLHSIKLPAAAEPFTPQPKQDRDFEAEALAAASFAAFHSLDVVPKIRIGRLLAPIKKPAMVETNDDFQQWSHPRPVTLAGDRPTRHSSQASLAGRFILLADRDKKFREEI